MPGFFFWCGAPAPQGCPALRPGSDHSFTGIGPMSGLPSAGGSSAYNPVSVESDVRRVGRVPDTDAAQARPLLGLFDQARVVVLAVRRRRRGRSDRRGRSGDEDPFAELFVVGDLQLRAPEGAMLHELRRAR